MRFLHTLLTFGLLVMVHSLPAQRIVTGAERTDIYFPLLKQKRVSLVVNHSSILKNNHLADTLLRAGIKISNIFAPEHGFRGDHADGADIKSGIDKKTGLPIISLYGNKKKPSAADLANTDVVVFDIQDVGARFYTYISTLHYIMEVCAEQQKMLIVLDRPNPNGFYVDGPVMDTACCRSFVGMHPVPMVYGMTIGEYACMINGEKWEGAKCNLEVIELLHYTHDSLYQLPVWPSPNLNTMEAIYLYPSICLFEGTQVSVGRGTTKPFTVIGSPHSGIGDYTFTPVSIPGKSDHPPQENKLCRGFDLFVEGKNIPLLKNGINLDWLLEFYGHSEKKNEFFIPYFEKLAGNKILRQQVIDGTSEKDIRKSWEPGLEGFKRIRKKYLLYP